MGGGNPRQCRKTPYNIVLGLLLTARRLSAVETQCLGMGNWVVPCERRIETARACTNDIQLRAPFVFEISKRGPCGADEIMPNPVAMQLRDMPGKGRLDKGIPFNLLSAEGAIHT